MVTVKIKDGTRQGSASLCVTCRYVHIVRGFSASEQQVRCQGVWPSQLMHFPVSQCSSYDDSRLPSKGDMEKVAWILLTKKTGRTIGFVTSKQFQEIEGEDAEPCGVLSLIFTVTMTNSFLRSARLRKALVVLQSAQTPRARFA